MTKDVSSSLLIILVQLELKLLNLGVIVNCISFKMDFKNPELQRIFTKFEELKTFDSEYKNKKQKAQRFREAERVDNSLKFVKKDTKIAEVKEEKVKKQSREGREEIIYTQSEISREVSKLKPYLVIRDNIKTTQELQQLRNKQVSQQNYKMLSELAIWENSKLCQIVDQSVNIESNVILDRQEKEKEGWIFEVFHRSSHSSKDDLNRKQFACGYAVMTDRVEIFESLAFQKKLITINPSLITLVRYEQKNHYEVISIFQDDFQVQCGFLDPKKFQLFDRMLFLQKNMSRSTSTRLFQNQLIRSIYSQYEKTVTNV